MDEEALQENQRNFTPSLWVKRTSPKTVMQEHVQFVTEESQRIKSTQDCSLNISYGPTKGQKLDLFGFDTLEKNAKIFVFVHGGCWQEMSREISAYCVAPLLRNNIAVVIMGYDLAPTVSVDEIVREIENGVKYVIKLAEERNSKGVYLCGHSAGAHLISMLLTSKLVADKTDLIKGFFMISGIFNLQLLVFTDINDKLYLNRTSASELSSMLKVNSIPKNVLENMKLYLVVGEFESPEFKSQTHKYSEALKTAGARFVHVSVLPSMDHFNIVEELHESNSAITQYLLQFICCP